MDLSASVRTSSGNTGRRPRNPFALVTSRSADTALSGPLHPAVLSPPSPRPSLICCSCLQGCRPIESRSGDASRCRREGRGENGGLDQRDEPVRNGIPGNGGESQNALGVSFKCFSQLQSAQRYRQGSWNRKNREELLTRLLGGGYYSVCGGYGAWPKA